MYVRIVALCVCMKVARLHGMPDSPGRVPVTPPARIPKRPTVHAFVCVETSSPNRRNGAKWYLRHRQTLEQRQAVADALARHARPSGEAFTVRLCRFSRSSRPLDNDNLVAALKAVRDAVAAWVGIDDGSARLVFEYSQRTRANRRGVDVELYPFTGDTLPPLYRRRTAHLPPEQVEALEVRRAEREARKSARELLFEALAPIVRCDESTVRDYAVMTLDERAAGGEVALSLPRRNGAAECVVAVRTWDGSDGKPARTYANAHVRWHGKGGKSARTRGIAIEAAELRPVAETLLALAEKLGV